MHARLDDDDLDRISALLEGLILVRLATLKEELMSAIDSLNKSVTDNTTAITAAVAKIGEQNQDPAIQAAADAITANTATLDAAVNPPAPVEPPAEPTA